MCWEKTRSNNLSCSRLLLRPVLKAGQQGSTTVALQLTRTQSITGAGMVPVGGHPFVGPRSLLHNRGP